ncbi:2-iminoacetate synthase ThiH [bacterium]|nr:2-iminoacetate synthase ThiH [bacterium]|tara:strand:- start:11489 stop:12568 length:1080 start_codon:yes stop_codon:yes gene_type:complete
MTSVFQAHTDVAPLLSTTPTHADLAALYSATHWSLYDMPALLDSRVDIEWLAHMSHTRTIQRFGHTMQLFAPVYLSNLCYNQCTYCGFSMEHEYPRKTLSMAEFQLELGILHRHGFRHVLLLTGEAPGSVDADYIAEAIHVAKKTFDSVGVEVQPLSQPDYEMLIQAGADSLTLYQETYHKQTYLKHHLRGKKRRQDWRLTAVESGATAGFYRINLGALLGLYDWRYEALCLGYHLTQLQQRYQAVQFGVSFPRIQGMFGEYTVEYPVSDSDLVRLIATFRLVFPDISITLSTREPAQLRDDLIPLGITTMSAASKTNPGGYSGHDTETQFDISDERSVQCIDAVLRDNGYCPVYTDWS